MQKTVSTPVWLALRVALILLILLSQPFAATQFVFSQDVGELEEELQNTQDEIDKKAKELAETQALINGILSSNLSLSGKIASLDAEINSKQALLDSKKLEITTKEQGIQKNEAEIQTKQLLMQRISRTLYKSTGSGVLEVLLNFENSEAMMRLYAYRRYAYDNHMKVVKKLDEEVASLNEQKVALEIAKQALETEQKALSESRALLDAQRVALQQQVAAQNALKASIEKQLGSLTNKLSEIQKAIIIARSGAYIPSVGSLPTGADYNASAAGFRANAPAGYFGVFAFGAWTHRKGMSQYGALGRANSGQTHVQILEKYYGKQPTPADTNGTIRVAGYGELDFEGRYLLGIAEMPSSWPLEALKAQAIAARTYAYRYKVQGLEICITQACQVYNNDKALNPPQAWRDAVDQTRGMILPDVVTYYSSTSGGYLTTSGWDTTDGTGSSAWTERAYEAIGGSPWFYKIWYRASYSNSSSSCGHEPWLSPEEIADIINAWLVTTGQGVIGSVNNTRIIPVTIGSCPINGVSGSPYSMAELRDLLGTPVTSISGPPVVLYDGNGSSSTVNFQTNRGTVSIPATEFKSIFNTRAPGYFSLPQNGFAFFNIERK